MADPTSKPPGSGPQPTFSQAHKHPRRTSPENSVTLRHHRLARETSRRNSPTTPLPHAAGNTSSPRRNDSDESNETGVSDPKHWFDKSNANPQGAFDATSMEVDPPFYQKETDSSNEDIAKEPAPLPGHPFRLADGRNPALLRPSLTHSSSADDYRSVIDDLTIENKRLREELKRYRQMGPDSLRRDKLFEVKIHGLPSRKRRELEATLRDFTTSLEGSSTGVSPKRKDKGSASKGGNSSLSKHASSSSGSRSRPMPTDSAYASMSTGPSSSNLSLPSKRTRQAADKSVQQYLQDIPEGLWPRRIVLSENDKKKLVVRRLEQLFTGKGIGQPEQPGMPESSTTIAPAPPALPGLAANDDVEMTNSDEKLLVPEAHREAQILSKTRGKATHSRDNESPNSNGDQTDSRENGNGSGSGSGSGGRNNVSPTDPSHQQQRPTRPRDLDPDRAQIPSENMDYLRHLGLTAPQAPQFSSRDVSPDAEGWVYLNLLGNLAQLHMFNVTPDFIRIAVSEKSTQFQLSPDGRKIRWRGGKEGTRFNSDSSGSNSQREHSDDTDGSNDQDQRKKQKLAGSRNEAVISEPSKFAQQLSSSSDSFHYKPLFVHQQTSSSEEQPSLGDETGSSYGAVDESNQGMMSRWDQSGVSGLSQRKRRRDGAIIYYTGAPFCTDLSGDGGETSTNSNDVHTSESAALDMSGPKFVRTASGSSIPFKPLSSLVSHHAMMDLDFTTPDLMPDEGDTSDDIDADFPWSNSSQSSSLIFLEASGLAGIYPDDHFLVEVSTRRPKTCKHTESSLGNQDDEGYPEDRAAAIAKLLATLPRDAALHQVRRAREPEDPPVEIRYVRRRIKRIAPAPLPPAGFFFNANSETDSDTNSWSEQGMSRRRSVRRSIYRGRVPMSGNEELSSGDEEDEEDDDGMLDRSGTSSPDKVGEITDNVGELGIGRRASGRVSDLSKVTRGSSAATAGGAVSGYSSMGDA